MSYHVSYRIRGQRYGLTFYRVSTLERALEFIGKDMREGFIEEHDIIFNIYKEYDLIFTSENKSRHI